MYMYVSTPHFPSASKQPHDLMCLYNLTPYLTLIQSVQCGMFLPCYFLYKSHCTNTDNRLYLFHLHNILNAEKCSVMDAYVLIYGMRQASR